jgi:hypothetical protein
LHRQINPRSGPSRKENPSFCVFLFNSLYIIASRYFAFHCLVKCGTVHGSASHVRICQH